MTVARAIRAGACAPWTTSAGFSLIVAKPSVMRTERMPIMGSGYRTLPARGRLLAAERPLEPARRLLLIRKMNHVGVRANLATRAGRDDLGDRVELGRRATPRVRRIIQAESEVCPDEDTVT